MLAQLGTEQYSYLHAVHLYNLRQWEGLETPPDEASYWYGILDGGTVRRHAHGGTRRSLDDLHESDGLFGLGWWLPHVPGQGHQCRGDRGESRDLLLVSDSGRGAARIKN